MAQVMSEEASREQFAAWLGKLQHDREKRRKVPLSMQAADHPMISIDEDEETVPSERIAKIVYGALGRCNEEDVLKPRSCCPQATTHCQSH